MIDAGYYLLERKHGVPAIWETSGKVQDFDTSTGKVIRDSNQHKIPRGILCKDSISNFEKVTTALLNVNTSYVLDTMTFMIRQTYLPKGFNLLKPDTNGTIIIAGIHYHIISFDISDSVVFIKLSRVL